MRARNSATRFGALSMLLHWALALLALGMLALGLYMHQLPVSPEKFELYALHKSLGVTTLALVCVWIVWRVANPPPPLPPSIPADHAKLARAAHWALFGCLVLMPLSGWGIASASGAPIELFGLGVMMPSPIPADDGTAFAFVVLHDLIGKVFMMLIAIHIGAALKHQFADKDATLRRMLPWGRVG